MSVSCHLGRALDVVLLQPLCHVAFRIMGKRAKKVVGLPCISLAAIHNAREEQRVKQLTWQPVPVQPEATNKRPAEPNDDPSLRPWLANRKDAAVCNFTRKARRPNNRETWSEEECAQALQALQRDYTASSSKGPNNSLLRTWEPMRRRMHQGRNDCFPLTVDKLARVGAAFKSCGYRSFANYLSKAKEQHIVMGGEWSDELQLEGRRVVRSVTRGIGPVQQRTPLDIDRILHAQKGRKIDHQPLVVDGPVGPYCLMVLGCYFLLREAEASLLLKGNVLLDTDRKQVTFRLPSSKTDAAAAGVERSWGCLCETHGMEGCPFHLAHLQSQFLYKLFGHQHPGQLPFFPTAQGVTVEKIKVVETFEQVHTRLGLPTTDEDGCRLLGGHSMRLAGARMLSAAGLHIYQIELLARWKSPMLLHYAQSAPLTRLTEDYAGTTRSNRDDLLDTIRHEISCLDRKPQTDTTITDIQNKLNELEVKLQSVDARTGTMIQEQLLRIKQQLLDRPCEYLRNLTSGTWHVVQQDGIGHAPANWTTICGWKFAMAQFVRCAKAPTVKDKRCDKCFPDTGHNSTDSDSSSSD